MGLMCPRLVSHSARDSLSLWLVVVTLLHWTVVNAMPPQVDVVEAMPRRDGVVDAMPPQVDVVEAMPRRDGVVNAMPPPKEKVHTVPPPKEKVHTVPPAKEKVKTMPPGNEVVEGMLFKDGAFKEDISAIKTRESQDGSPQISVSVGRFPWPLGHLLSPIWSIFKTVDRSEEDQKKQIATSPFSGEKEVDGSGVGAEIEITVSGIVEDEDGRHGDFPFIKGFQGEPAPVLPPDPLKVGLSGRIQERRNNIGDINKSFGVSKQIWFDRIDSVGSEGIARKPAGNLWPFAIPQVHSGRPKTNKENYDSNMMKSIEKMELPEKPKGNVFQLEEQTARPEGTSVSSNDQGKSKRRQTKADRTPVELFLEGREDADKTVQSDMAAVSILDKSLHQLIHWMDSDGATAENTASRIQVAKNSLKKVVGGVPGMMRKDQTPPKTGTETIRSANGANALTKDNASGKNAKQFKGKSIDMNMNWIQEIKINPKVSSSQEQNAHKSKEIHTTMEEKKYPVEDLIAKYSSNKEYPDTKRNISPNKIINIGEKEDTAQGENDGTDKAEKSPGS
ncbi:hypothetical protein EGW08_018901, partial [Elysia chlorotica]